MILWQKLKEHDPDAFDHIYTTYRKWLMVVACSMVQHETEAQDLVQKFYMDLWQMDWSRTGALAGPIKNFLFISIRNRCLNYIRSNEILRKRAARLQLPPDYEPPADILEHKELQQHLADAIAQLPAVRARVFKLGYLHQFSRQQIAGYLGISEATVKTHMALALKDLRNLLKNKVY